MKTITFLNSKGGTGKTTLCANVCERLRRGCKTMLIDADPQGSLRDWHDVGKDLENPRLLICADSRQSLFSAERLASGNNCGYLFIDTPGHLAQINGAAISLSDLVIIPIQPSALDVWSTIDVIDTIKSAMRANPKLQSLFVINRAIQGSKITSELLRAISEADPENTIPVFGEPIYNRVVYARTMAEGKTIFDARDKAAWEEITKLTEEIITRLHNETANETN